MIYDMSTEFGRRKAQEYLAKLSTAEKGMVEIKQKRKTRSNPQNRLFYAYVSELANYTGFTIEEMKSIIKRENGLVYERNGERFLKSSAGLDTSEFAKFIDRVQSWAARKIGYTLPDPEEYERNWQYYENQKAGRNVPNN